MFLMSNHVAIFNILHKNVLSSSRHFYHFSLSFYQHLFFINSIFYIFYVNSINNILTGIYLTGIIGFYFAITK